jgi:hypothetical protein
VLADAVRCCALERAHGAVEGALVLVAQLAASPALQVTRAARWCEQAWLGGGDACLLPCWTRT